MEADRPALARRDVEAALAARPRDAHVCLAALQILEGEEGLEIFGIFEATPQQRRRAVASLTMSHAGAWRQTRLSATVRVTCIWDQEDPPQVLGGEPADLLEVLGRRALPEGNLIVTEHFFQRGREDRRVEIVLAGERHEVTVPALPRLARAHDPEEKPAALWIVIPVYGAPEALELCLSGVMRELRDNPDMQLMLVDDASPDAAIAEHLQKAQQLPRVRVFRRAQNGGFTAAVNDGLARCGPGPVLLLNSDTYVPPKTFPRLLAHLSDPKIGTVTALSNNGGSFSIPAPLKSSEMPSRQKADALARAAWALFPGQSADVVTGNGFAMLISAAAREAVGPLSGEFESGYFEEVDFCLRASRREFRHLAALDCFVGHEGSQSYGAAKQALVEENRARLAAKFPSYHGKYEGFMALRPLVPFGEAIIAEANWAPTPSPEAPLKAAPAAVIPYDGPPLSARAQACLGAVFLVPRETWPSSFTSEISLRYASATKAFEARARTGEIVAEIASQDWDTSKIGAFQERLLARVSHVWHGQPPLEAGHPTGAHTRGQQDERGLRG